MNKLWICIALLAVFGGLSNADLSPLDWPDDANWYSDELEDLGSLDESQDYSEENVKNAVSEEKIEKKDDDLDTVETSDIDNDTKVAEEIEKFENENLENLNSNEDSNDEIDNIDDYQIEDNRSEVKEDDKKGADDLVEDIDYADNNEPKENNEMEVESFEDDVKQDDDKEPEQEVDDNRSDYEDNILEEELDENNDTDDMEDEEEKKILEETKALLNSDDDDNDFAGDKFVEKSEDANKLDNMEEGGDDDEEQKILDETKTLLRSDIENDFDTFSELSGEEKEIELSDQLDEFKNKLQGFMDAIELDDTVGEDDEEKKILEETKALLNSYSDNDFANDNFSELSVEEKDSELNNRLDELKKMLQEFDVDDKLDDTADDDDKSLEEDLNISEKDVDDKEDSLDKAYEDLHKDLQKLDEIWNKLNDDLEADDLDAPGSDELKNAEVEAKEQDDDYEVIDDENLHKIFADRKSDEDQVIDHVVEDADEDQSLDDVVEAAEEDDLSEQSDDNSVQEEAIQVQFSRNIQYVNDAVVASDAEEKSETSTVEATTQTTTPTTTISTSTAKQHDVEPLEENVELNSGEFNKLIEDFINLHSDELHAEADTSDTVEAIRMKLSLDEPVVVTSPNYPSAYPTNAIVDWILEGEGMGIEFNVTDFDVNGNNGDYVLVKPGRVDADGNDGLVFSYTLLSERRYRFTNVNRMFIRFEAKPGFPWKRGFSFSVKLISPLPEEKIAEPEVMPIPYPEYTLTVNLGGVTLEDFLLVQEEFRIIVADMATTYINEHAIAPGLNATSEVTQITSTALCYHNWPQFERCAEVRFGVPLQYEDEEPQRLDEDDLRKMWYDYSQRDPFALRLGRLNITEYQIPDDRNVMMVWMVIAAGVIISMAMLMFALWRYSCFEEYTRMPTFSDTESLKEKKTLDLYPTPHQTLPPLYAETDYKWGDPKFDDSTRVDMGGFANRSYVRTEPYDFDSEEEVVPSRDRNASISPRDVYNV